MFDHWFGTSTGGILSLGAVYADKSGAELVEMYRSLAPAIFPNEWKIAMAYRALSDKAVYTADGLDVELQKVLGTHKLATGNPIKVALVSRKELDSGPFLLRNWDQKDYFNPMAASPGEPNWLCVHAARATSAARPYLP